MVAYIEKLLLTVLKQMCDQQITKFRCKKIQKQKVVHYLTKGDTFAGLPRRS
jgi:hypothetical protein